ncbi:acyl-CoA dehydrogenase [candidate division KSB1 bacterium]|nr:acyl-CoA dehydrogenase [candidate division KSB1 bacterium]
MELTDTQKKFQESVREFCKQEVEPHAARIDQKGEFPHDVMDKVADFGLFGCVVPKEYGGLGVDTVSYAIAVEELSRVCGSTGITVAAHNSLGVMPFLLFGSQQQIEEYVPPLAKAKEGLSAFGLTEPEAGSDAGGTKTTGVRDGDDWIVNGNKCFITNAGVAKTLVITAKTDKIPGSRGISSFIVDKDTPGFIIGKKEDKMGLRGSDTRELAFENMRLSADKMLGKEGEGFKQFMIILDGGRVSIGAMALGLAQGAFDHCLRYARERELNNCPITGFQAIQWKLADMYTKIQCARHLIYHAARLEDAHRKFSTESAMAKLYASEIATEIAHDAIQVVGGRGYMEDMPLERIYRDVRLCEIGEGTSEIQRLVIARDLIKRVLD